MTPKQQQAATARLLGYHVISMLPDIDVQVLDPEGCFVVYIIPGREESGDPLTSDVVADHMLRKYGINCNHYTPEGKNYDS